MIWIPVTLLTQPVPQEVLQNFFRKVNPPGFWKGWQREKASNQAELRLGLWNWVIGTAALFLTTFGLIDLFLMHWFPAVTNLALSAIGWWMIAKQFRNPRPSSKREVLTTASCTVTDFDYNSQQSKEPTS